MERILQRPQEAFGLLREGEHEEHTLFGMFLGRNEQSSLDLDMLRHTPSVVFPVPGSAHFRGFSAVPQRSCRAAGRGRMFSSEGGCVGDYEQRNPQQTCG